MLKRQLLMKVEDPDKTLEEKAADALQAVLTRIPFARVKRLPSLPDTDATIRLELPRSERMLIGEFKKSGQPRVAKNAIDQLEARLSGYPNSYGVFMAPYISAAVADLCAARGIGYSDLSGNCQLVFDSVYIRVDGQPNRFAQNRDLRSLHSPRALRVLRVLLKDARRGRKTVPLAEEASVSLGQVANVKKLLGDREWIADDDSGFWLINPEAVLKEWAESPDFRKDTRLEYYSPKPGAELVRQLPQVQREGAFRYALTEFSAANFYAPMVKSPRASLYIAVDPLYLQDKLGLKPVASGSNVSLIQPGDMGVLNDVEFMEDTWVASPVQTYVDLKRLGGRGDDAAAAILEQVLRPKWQPKT
jgi:hypothetical protein